MISSLIDGYLVVPFEMEQAGGKKRFKIEGIKNSVLGMLNWKQYGTIQVKLSDRLVNG